MKFDINVWLSYRKQARIIADYIQAHKEIFYDFHGNFKKCKLNMEKYELEYNIKKITLILKECSEYLDRCGMNIPKSLWKYDNDDPTTWVSSKHFAYEHLLV
jgi:hypothetical protein